MFAVHDDVEFSVYTNLTRFLYSNMLQYGLVSFTLSNKILVAFSSFSVKQ